MKYLRNRLTIPVKGYNRSIVYDITRKDYHFIPNEIFNVISSDELFDIDKNVGLEKFLIDEEIIFECSENEVGFFPSLSTDYQCPYDFLSIIIDSDFDLSYDDQFKNVSVSNLAIITKNLRKGLVLSEGLKDLIEHIEPDSIDLYLTESNLELKDQDFEYVMNTKEVFKVFVFETKENEKILKRLNESLVGLCHIEDGFEFFSSQVFPFKFDVNKEFFVESKSRNTYYNKKIYIDKKGNISNGLYTEKELSFKTIKSYTEIINNEKITKRWDIIKERTPVCKDCEFRNMCVDSRDITYHEEDNSWRHKEECRYNPYISKWQNEEGYMTLEACGIKITGGKTIFDKNKLDSINNSLWVDE